MDYNKTFETTIKDFGKEKKRLLLHACCAPCSTAVLERLAGFFDVTLYFYNPNIDTVNEHDKRADELNKLRSRFDIKDVIIIPYNPNEFDSVARGFESAPEGGRRCGECISLRLNKTAGYAKEHDFDYFCTTLTVSPHKNSEYINNAGAALLKGGGTIYLYSDFKKKNGFIRSAELSKELDLYRQNYCGCRFTKPENNIIL